AHYRETFNFTLEGLEGARSALGRIDECLTKLREISGDAKAQAHAALISGFTNALDHDFNVSGAWGIIFEWIRDTNRALAANSITPGQAASALGAWERIDSVLGLGQGSTDGPPPELQNLLEEREAARKSKDFKRADAIRDEL